eukprot:EG_transcript_37338
MGSGPPFEIRPIDAKGLGAFATRFIRKGERLLAEPPILTLPPKGTTLRRLVAQLPSIEGRERYVRTLVARLAPTAREAFWGLADAHAAPPAKTAYGIARTNGLSLGGRVAVAGIFPTIARLNHSCTPNVHNEWHAGRGRAVLHATRDIGPGEELCLRYIPLDLDRA